MAPLLGWTLTRKALEAVVVLFHAVSGSLLILGYELRAAAVLLLFVQLNVFLGTFHQRSFNELVGLSLWLCAYYGLRPKNAAAWNQRLWDALTLGLLFLLILYISNRYWAGDPWLSSVSLQRAHFEGYIMPISPAWKEAVLWLTAGPLGGWVWVMRWWMELGLCILFLTRLRLQAGALLLVIAIVKELTWLNTLTSQGVLWTLVLLVWVTQEELLQRRKLVNHSLDLTKNSL